METRAAIEKLLEIDPNMKPGKIIQNLEKDSNIKIPLKADLNNFLHTVRVKKYGSNMNLGELAAWCLDHCHVPEDIDEPFVVDYNIFFPDDEPEDRRGDFEVDEDGVADMFRFFVTSRRLLLFKKKS